MSEPSGSSEQNADQRPQEESLSKEFVSDTIKEAFGSFKDYFESTLQKVKADSDKKLSAASSELQELKRSAELQFRFKGNKAQFEFNAKVQEKLEKGVAYVEEGATGSGVDLVKGAIADLKRRKKLIRLADKSDAGWAAVDEYESDELASDSDDGKKIRQAQARAITKKRKRPLGVGKAKQRYNTTEYGVASSSSDHFFRGFQSRNRYSAGSSNYQQGQGWRSSSFRYGGKPGDFCYGCGERGHWRKDCHATNKQSYKDGGAQGQR